jgi:hypothetical protein
MYIEKLNSNFFYLTMSKNILHEIDDTQKYFLPNDKLDGMSKNILHEVDETR